MNITILLTSFLAGILTILTPCSLPLLPTILGSSTQSKSYKRIFAIVFSLALSIFLFTIFIKAGVVSLGISEDTLRIISALIILVLGIFTLFPNLWSYISVKIGLEAKSANLLSTGVQKEGYIGAILTGFALGPVFTSCSPTYGYILFAILPTSFSSAIIYLLAFILGASLFLIVIAIIGQKLIYKLKWATNPKSSFKKVIGIIFIVIAISILFKIDKQIEAFLLEQDFILNILPNRVEQGFIDQLSN